MLKDIKDYNEGSLCVERFYLHFMKDAWIDFHLDFTGSSIWHHVLKVLITAYLYLRNTDVSIFLPYNLGKDWNNNENINKYFEGRRGALFSGFVWSNQKNLHGLGGQGQTWKADGVVAC